MGVVWRAFWSSRAAVWVGGLAALVLFGMPGETVVRLDPLALTYPFESSIANAIVAPAVRWDSAHYIAISAFGYADPDAPAFFPLLPLLIAPGGVAGGALLIGLCVSIVSALAGMLLLHRLVALDFGSEVATTTVMLLAWYPGSLALSGVYTDALFLALSVGSIYSARRGRWATAGALGALAAMTRSAGLGLVVPLLALYVWGPRADRAAPVGGGSGSSLAERLRSRYAIERSIAWVALVPAGLAAYAAYLGIETGNPLAFVTAQDEWERIVAPLAGLPLAVWGAIQGVGQFLPGVGPDSVLTPAGPYPAGVGLRNVALLGFLALALWLLTESFRRLPLAYAAYAVAALALPLSVPALDEPLKSLPRFMLVVFPLWIALALWVRERERRFRWVSGAFGFLLVVFAGLFTTWVQAP